MHAKAGAPERIELEAGDARTPAAAVVLLDVSERRRAEVARRAGLPGRARMVARVLGGNGDDSLPWHRVLRSDGRIAFPEGSAGHLEQSRRLRAEGVEVQRGRVRMPSRAGDLDAELWGAP